MFSTNMSLCNRHAMIGYYQVNIVVNYAGHINLQCSASYDLPQAWWLAEDDKLVYKAYFYNTMLILFTLIV